MTLPALSEFQANIYGTEQRIEDIIENLEFLDDWEERYSYIIDLGKSLPAFPESEKTDENFVHGCQSQVWLIHLYDPDSGKLYFLIDSDAIIVKGLAAIVMASLNAKAPEEIVATDVEAIFDQIDLMRHISPTRGNGLRSMLELAKDIAQKSGVNVPETSPDFSETIHLEADAYFDSMLYAISQAKHQICMETYIFSGDELGRRFADKLYAAAKRGVHVRLIVDGVGTDADFLPIAKHMQQAGVQVWIFHPLPWDFKTWPYALVGYRGLRKLLYLINFINKRNHRKLLIVDHAHIWTGSFNISNTHLPVTEGGQSWRDTGVEVHGIDTHLPRQAFNANWSRWKRRHRKSLAQEIRRSTFFFNFTRALRYYHKYLLLRHIEQAKHRIWITNAYFVPDNALLGALIQASERGVDVRILLPGKSDVFFLPWMSSYFYQKLLLAGVRVFEYHPHFLHAKTMLVDDWGRVGSSNLNRRSLFHDLEVDYTVQTEVSIQTLEKAYEDDLSYAEELSIDSLKAHKRWQRRIGALLLILFGYWV